MSDTSKYTRAAAWFILIAAIGLVSALFLRGQWLRSDLPVLSQTAGFTLTNQHGAVVTDEALRGKVWVADIIFTRCPGPCPRMTEEMSKLQNQFPGEDRLRFVTLTTDPAHDTPDVLNTYATRFGADHDRWYFLTGATNEIRELAIGGLKLTSVPKEEEYREGPADLFIHSTIFVVVDKAGRVRGVHESLEPGFQENITADIKALLREQ